MVGYIDCVLCGIYPDDMFDGGCESGVGLREVDGPVRMGSGNGGGAGGGTAFGDTAVRASRGA